MSSPSAILIVTAEPSEADAVCEARDSIAAATTRGLSLRIGAGEPVALPESVAKIVVESLRTLAAGQGLVLQRTPDELTTQQAADLLGVSRPFITDLCDRGRLTHRRIGAHRRIRLADVQALQQQMTEMHECESELRLVLLSDL